MRRVCLSIGDMSLSNLVASIAQRRIVGSATKKSVLMYMAERASDDGSGIWTSKSNMSADTELSKRSIQAAIRDFEDAGIVRQVGTRACKHGFTIEYSINVEALKSLPSTREATGAGDSPVQEIHPKGCTTFTPTGAGDSPKPSLEPSLEPSLCARDELTLFPEETQPKRQDQTSDRFEEFWNVYPKKTGKKAARAKFAAAVKAGADADALIEGARRYADACVGRDPHFIKWPQGWLSEERWTDDPEPPEPTRSSGHRVSRPWGEVVR